MVILIHAETNKRKNNKYAFEWNKSNVNILTYK